MARHGGIDPEKSLATRAAWLHYAGGLTQAAVAKRLGVTGVKAHRLIARAVADGAVKVSIDGAIVECAALEDRLCKRYGLAFCEVAPDLGEDGIPLRGPAVCAGKSNGGNIASSDWAMAARWPPRSGNCRASMRMARISCRCWAG